MRSFSVFTVIFHVSRVEAYFYVRISFAWNMSKYKQKMGKDERFFAECLNDSADCE